MPPQDRYIVVRRQGVVEVVPGCNSPFDLTTAFRIAKVVACWEVPGPNGIGEPVCRNVRGEHGDYVAGRAR